MATSSILRNFFCPEDKFKDLVDAIEESYEFAESQRDAELQREIEVNYIEAVEEFKRYFAEQ